MGNEPAPVEAGRDGLGELIGIEYVDHSDELVRARVEVTDRIRQPYGIVHGGAYSAIAETICSYATGIAAWSEGKLAMGQSTSAITSSTTSAARPAATISSRPWSLSTYASRILSSSSYGGRDSSSRWPGRSSADGARSSTEVGTSSRSASEFR